jgi:acetyltransferase-like isoleucine patch superfamily enzyme
MTFYTAEYLKSSIKSGRASVGRHSYGNITLVGEESRIEIGNFCSIGIGCVAFIGQYHRPDFTTTYPFNKIGYWQAEELTGHPTSKGDVFIGNDVWIGMGVNILSGVTIGDGAVIGARAVVTKNVEPYSFVAGNPARHIKYRFKADVIEKLLKIRWWDWDDEKIKEAVPWLFRDDVDGFIARYYQKNL